jgi:conjugal transfer/entry exclusion protein
MFTPEQIQQLLNRIDLLEQQVENLTKGMPVKEWYSLEEFMSVTGASKQTAYGYSTDRVITTTLASGLKFSVADTHRWLRSKQRKSKYQLKNQAA